MELSVCWFDKVQNNGFFMLWQMWQIKQLWQVQNAQKQKMLRFARLADKTVLANTRHTYHALIRYSPNSPHLPNAFFEEKHHLPC